MLRSRLSRSQCAESITFSINFSPYTRHYEIRIGKILHKFSSRVMAAIHGKCLLFERYRIFNTKKFRIGGLLWLRFPWICAYACRKKRRNNSNNDVQLLNMCRIVKQLSSCCRNVRLVANLLDLNNKQWKETAQRRRSC